MVLQGFNVDAVTPGASPSITISDIDGDVIPQLVRDNIDNTKFPFLFTRTGGQPEAVIEGEVLSYNATTRMWENNTPAEAGLITQVIAGEGSEAQTLNPTDTSSSVTILQATPDGDGVMSSEDKFKLDNIPERPQTINGMPVSATNPAIPLGQTGNYALAVERTSTTGTDQFRETWVDINDLVTTGGSNLIFVDDADTNGTQLQRYRQGSTERSIVSTRFVNADGDNVGALAGDTRYLAFRFGVFDPDLSNFPFSRAWDQPVTSIRAGVDNPDGVTQYISSVRGISVSGTANSAVTLTDFTAGNFRNTGNTANVTPAAEVDWIQDFATTSILASGRTAAGETVTATLQYNQHDGTTETPFTTSTSSDVITWNAVSANAPTATLASTSINFYERVTGITMRANISGLSTSTNGRIDWIANAGLSGGRTTPGVSGTSLTETYTLVTPLYKDRTRILSTDNATVTATMIATRPPSVAGTAYNVTLQNNADSNIPNAIGVNMPFFRLTIDDTTTPTAYGTGVGAILDGDFDTGNGLVLNTAGNSDLVTRTSFNTIGGDFNFAADTFFWFGVPSNATQPTTFRLAQPLPVTPDLVMVNNALPTVAFDNTFTNAPSGWTTVNYTFYGFRVAAGAATITIS